MQNMESAVYEKVSEFITLMGRTELLTCSATRHSFGKIRDQAQQLTREYNLQCVYLYYPVLKQHIQVGIRLFLTTSKYYKPSSIMLVFYSRVIVRLLNSQVNSRYLFVVTILVATRLKY